MTLGGSAPLVSAALTGDEGAWRELYRRHARRLVVWVGSLPLPDAAASADDIAAEAWLTAASKLAKFRGSDDDFAGWLFGIARKHALNSQRTAMRRRTSPIAVHASPDAMWGQATDTFTSVEGQDTTRQLLAHLSPREAEVIACVDVVGLDVASTAKALDMSPTAVRVARHRALGRLRKILLEPENSLRRVTATPSAV